MSQSHWEGSHVQPDGPAQIQESVRRPGGLRVQSIPGAVAVVIGRGMDPSEGYEELRIALGNSGLCLGYLLLLDHESWANAPAAAQRARDRVRVLTSADLREFVEDVDQESPEAIGRHFLEVLGEQATSWVKGGAAKPVNRAAALPR